jgi:hypothetical protein
MRGRHVTLPACPIALRATRSGTPGEEILPAPAPAKGLANCPLVQVEEEPREFKATCRQFWALDRIGG